MNPFLSQRGSNHFSVANVGQGDYAGSRYHVETANRGEDFLRPFSPA